MEQQTLEEIAEELKKCEGNVKAEVIRVQKDYVLSREGEEGVKKLQEKMDELGADINLNELKPSNWEKDWKDALMLIVAKEIFNWKDEDIFEMGRYSPRASFFIKSIIQYLVSTEMVFKNANLYWRKQQDFGEIESVELNNEQRYAIVRIKGVQTHPILCIYHAGYFKGVIEFTVKSKNVTVEETECIHKGGNYHEYLIKW